MTSNLDYKKYSLKQVENFLYDVMSTEATPQEIYDVIIGVVKDNYYTYKHQASQAYELLALLNGNNKCEDHLNKIFSCNKDDQSPECQKSWTKFWEDVPVPVYVSEDGDVWAPDTVVKKEDKVKKWVLPVEEVKDSDTNNTEYFVSFPQDLLEATDLKEGDQVEWVDQGDGSYILRKVTKSLTMDEC